MPSVICRQVVSLSWKSTYSDTSTPWILSSTTSWKSTRGKNSCHSGSRSLSEFPAGEGWAQFVVLCKCMWTGLKMDQHKTHHLNYCTHGGMTPAWCRNSRESLCSSLGARSLSKCPDKNAFLVMNTVPSWVIYKKPHLIAHDWMNPESLWTQFICRGITKQNKTPFLRNYAFSS